MEHHQNYLELDGELNLHCPVRGSQLFPAGTLTVTVRGQ